MCDVEQNETVFVAVNAVVVVVVVVVTAATAAVVDKMKAGMMDFAFRLERCEKEFRKYN